MTFKNKCTASYDRKCIYTCISIFSKFSLCSGFLCLHDTHGNFSQKFFFFPFFPRHFFYIFPGLCEPSVSFCNSASVLQISRNQVLTGLIFLGGWFSSLVVINNWNYHEDGNTGPQRSILLLQAHSS